MERIRSMVRLTLVTVVSGALAFGGVRALDNGRAECPSDPPTFPGASCSTASQCEGPCRETHPDAWWWDCDLPEGCCVCAIR